MSRPLKNLDVQSVKQLRDEFIVSVGADVFSQKRAHALSRLVYERTRVLLSISTLQRFLNDDASVRPSSSTLDAIAVYLGFDSYSHWLQKRHFNRNFLQYLESLSRARESKSVKAMGKEQVWNSPHQTWFLTGLMLTPMSNWPELFSEAQVRMQSWEDQYLAGLSLALSMRNGHIQVGQLPDEVVNHPFFLERITTYFIDEERPEWYLAIMPAAAECPEKSWRKADKKAIQFSLKHLTDYTFDSKVISHWDQLFEETHDMSSVPVARIAGCYSQLDAGRKTQLLGFIDQWFTALPAEEQLRSIQFLIRQLHRCDWPEIQEVLKPTTDRFSPQTMQQEIELQHFKSLQSALSGSSCESAIFYHLHNSKMNKFHFNRIREQA